MVLVCCISIFSCTKETKETIIIEGGVASGRGDGMTKEEDSLWATLPNVLMNENDIVIPGNRGITLKQFENELASGMWDSWIKGAKLKKTGDETFPKTVDNFKTLFFGRLTASANAYIKNTFDKYNIEDDKDPKQTRLVYCLGGKDYTIRTIPKKGDGVTNSECDAVYGLDCSGLVYNILKDATSKENLPSNYNRTGNAKSQYDFGISELKFALNQFDKDFKDSFYVRLEYIYLV